jgi:hypothetical protein
MSVHLSGIQLTINLGITVENEGAIRCCQVQLLTPLTTDKQSGEQEAHHNAWCDDNGRKLLIIEV